MTKWVLLVTIVLSSLSYKTYAQLRYPDILSRGFSKTLADEKEASPLSTYCQKLGKKFKALSWNRKPCGDVPWKQYGTTAQGNPLIYWAFGKGKQVTLVLSGVHPDEYTPVPMGFKLARYIRQNPKSFQTDTYRVVIAPLVNPDGFLRKRPTRVNASGIDPNRNFFTKDWYQKALKTWRYRKGKSPRHFPGFFPNTEAETQFQVFLIEQYKPDKIISIHAPLGFLDYDGPGDRVTRPKSLSDRKAKRLANAISEKSNNYRVVDHSFFPGSLGNFAGNDKKVPTVTLELKTIDSRKVRTYWKQFLPGILQSIEYPFERYGLNGKEESLKN